MTKDSVQNVQKAHCKCHSLAAEPFLDSLILAGCDLPLRCLPSFLGNMQTSRSCLPIEPQEVESIPGKSDLVDSIRSYVNPAKSSNGPKNVAIFVVTIFFAATALTLRKDGVEPATDRFILNNLPVSIENNFACK